MTGTKCILCLHGDLIPVKDPAGLKGVTSDCKPWPRAGSFAVCGRCGHLQKIIDKRWREDTGRIYGDYEAYGLGGGEEQALFTGAAPEPRTKCLLKRLLDVVDLPGEGRMLDIGCGNGALLKTFGELHPRWRLCGYEQGDKTRADVLKRQGVEAFYSGTLESVEGSFDLIVMTYVIEHLTEPVEVLAAARRMTRPGGVMIVQTSNYLENPFDLVVVDHCSHFTKETLSAAAEAAGFDIACSTEGWIPKETGVVLRPSFARTEVPPSEAAHDSVKSAEKALEWLGEAGSGAMAAAKGAKLGVFGTAIAGTWLANTIGDSAGYFVDEDPSRQGKRHMGLPVLAPGEAAGRVYLAFPPAIAETIKKRMEGRMEKLSFIVPPPYSHEAARSV